MASEPLSPDIPPTKPGLGVHSARGFVYLLSGTAASKLVTVLGQVALAYLLSERDFGVVGLAYTITVFIQVIEQAGVGDILVQRRNFRRWAVPAFWLAFATGVISTSLIMASAPFAARIYGDPQLLPVLFGLAPGSFFNALTVVPRAQLTSELRFRALAGINLFSLTLRTVLTVAFAAAGFGPFSFVVPVPITNATTAALLWWWVRPHWSWRPQFRRWWYLVGDSMRILMAELQRAIIDQSDYMMLRLFHTSVEIVGIYWFGFNFSIQILQLLATNLMNILFPAFTTLNDRPDRQFQAFLKAQRILATIGISSCFLQAAVSKPLTLLLLPARWEPSITVMQILSIGMSMRMLSGSSYALLKSQGRFRVILWSRWGIVTLQLAAMALVLGLGGNYVSVAVVVAVVASIVGPITFYIAVLPYGAGWGAVAGVLVRPIASSLVAVGIAWRIQIGMASQGYGNVVQLVETILIAISLNAFLVWLWMRPVWNDLWARIGTLRGRRAIAKA